MDHCVPLYTLSQKILTHFAPPRFSSPSHIFLYNLFYLHVTQLEGIFLVHGDFSINYFPPFYSHRKMYELIWSPLGSNALLNFVVREIRKISLRPAKLRRINVIYKTNFIYCYLFVFIYVLCI